MLTGRQAFEGDDVSEILASVIKGTANLDLLPADIHPGVRRVIGRCLEKDVRKRFRDIGDVRNELERDPGESRRAPDDRPQTHSHQPDGCFRGSAERLRSRRSSSAPPCGS